MVEGWDHWPMICLPTFAKAWKWDITMRKVLPVCLLLSLVALFAVGCGSNPNPSFRSPPPATVTPATPATTVDITSSGFVPMQIRANTGQVVMFINKTNSPAHICLGSLGTCAGTTFGPRALTGNGIQLVKNESFPVVFDKAGTFRVTSPGNTNQSMSIVVQGP